MLIPKIVHYCWFGGSELPQEHSQYITKWKELLPDYTIIRWDESNCDIHANHYIEKAYLAKKWAFVSDYFRLKALWEYGGIYLDTDVELKKSFNNLLHYELFVGYIWDCTIGTAVIGAEPNSDAIQELLSWYEQKEHAKFVPNNYLFTEYFLKQPWFSLNGKTTVHEGMAVFCKETFEIPPLIGNGYSIHHIANSWVIHQKESAFKKILKKILPYRLWCQLRANKALKGSPYYLLYKESVKKESVHS